MTLDELLHETGQRAELYGGPDSGELWVYGATDPRYWRLDDYAVSGTTGGPGITLWRRQTEPWWLRKENVP